MVLEQYGAGAIVGGSEVAGTLLEKPSVVSAEASFGLDRPLSFQSGGTESSCALLPFDRMGVGGEHPLPLRRIHSDNLDR